MRKNRNPRCQNTLFNIRSLAPDFCGLFAARAPEIGLEVEMVATMVYNQVNTSVQGTYVSEVNHFPAY